MFYIDQLRNPSFPIGLVKTESGFIVRPDNFEVATKMLLHQQVKTPE